MGGIGSSSPSSKSILRSQDLFGGRESAWPLLKTSAKSWYFFGILFRSASESEGLADHAEAVIKERFN